MYLPHLNAYFLELEKASNELSDLDSNLSVYKGMTHFNGLAVGAETAAKQYMQYAPTRILLLKTKLNNGKVPKCQTYQKSIKLKEVKFPSNPGHMR